jgi:hypothetical protein
MILRCTIEEAEAALGHPPPYSDLDASKLLAARGYALGGWGTGPEGIDITNNCLSVRWPLDQLRAYLVVESERFPDKTHVIYWDGKQVWDPNPETPDGRPLSSYEIECLFPLVEWDKESNYA